LGVTFFEKKAFPQTPFKKTLKYLKCFIVIALLPKTRRGEPNAHELTILINFSSRFPGYTINRNFDLGVNSYLVVYHVGFFNSGFFKVCIPP
jgi:hypothetical protein